MFARRTLSPSIKRYLALGGCAAVVFGLGWLVTLGTDPVVSSESDSRAVYESVLLTGDTRQASLEGVASQLDVLQGRLSRMESELKTERSRRQTSFESLIDDLRSQMIEADRDAQAKLAAQIEGLQRLQSGDVSIAVNEATTDSESGTREGTGAIDPDAKTEPASSQSDVLRADAKPAIYRPSRRAAEASEPLEDNRSSRVEEIFQRAPQASPQAGPQTLPGQALSGGGPLQSSGEIRLISTETSVEQSGRRAGGMAVRLPVGSVLNGLLLNGLDAPGGTAASRDPLPVLVRIKHDAILPNGFSADVSECFLLMSARGELSAERAMLRGEQLSCLMSDGTVIEEKVRAYAVGEDGKVGLRGKVVSKRGRLIANAITVGILDSAAEAVRRAGSVTIGVGTGGSGGGLTDAGSGAIGSGASDALDRVADWYLKQADQLFPVVEIAPGRQIDIVLSEGMQFRLDQ